MYRTIDPFFIPILGEIVYVIVADPDPLDRGTYPDPDQDPSLL